MFGMWIKKWSRIRGIARHKVCMVLPISLLFKQNLPPFRAESAGPYRTLSLFLSRGVSALHVHDQNRPLMLWASTIWTKKLPEEICVLSYILYCYTYQLITYSCPPYGTHSNFVHDTVNYLMSVTYDNVG